MKILYIINFNAPMGGLHENLFSTALYMKGKGCEVYILLKDGLLEKRLKKENINTIITDFTDIKDDINKINKLNITFDIIHYHPGLPQKIALQLSEDENIPLIKTCHGMWLDSLGRYIKDIDAVISVSEGVRSFLQKNVTAYPERFYVMRNGYNPTLFNSPQYFNIENNEINIGLVSRLDDDKQFIMDIFILLVTHLKHYDESKLNINIIGDGTKKSEFIRICKRILKNTNHLINFKGWLTDEELKQSYLECDIVVAPGRSAIEAMACGKPVIAVGSKKYIGLIKEDNWQFGVYNNFGGVGNKFLDYEVGSVESDIDLLLYDKNRINTLGKFSRKIADSFFNSDNINLEIYNLYQIFTNIRNN